MPAVLRMALAEQLSRTARPGEGAPGPARPMSAMQRAILSSILANTMREPQTVAQGLSGVARAALLTRFLSPEMMRDTQVQPEIISPGSGGAYRINADGSVEQIVPGRPSGSGVNVSVYGDGSTSLMPSQKALNKAMQENFHTLITSQPRLRQVRTLLKSMEVAAGATDETGAGLRNTVLRKWKDAGLGEFNFATAQLQSAISQYLKATRVPGSGDQSENELKIVMDALPQMEQSSHTNVYIARLLIRDIDNKINAAKLAGTWAAATHSKNYDRVISLLQELGISTHGLKRSMADGTFGDLEMDDIMNGIIGNHGLPLTTPKDLDDLAKVDLNTAEVARKMRRHIVGLGYEVRDGKWVRRVDGGAR